MLLYNFIHPSDNLRPQKGQREAYGSVVLFAALSRTHSREGEQLQHRQLHKLLLAGLFQAVPAGSG